MQSIINFIKLIALAIILIFLHYVVSYLFPPPFNNLNIIFVAVILFIMGWESSASIWLAFIFNFFIELYSATPFGLVIVSNVVSVALVYMLYVYIFTNRSWYSAVALSSIAIVFYRIIYSILFISLNFSSVGLSIGWETVAVSYFWELLLTAVVSGLAVLVLSKVLDRFKSQQMFF